MDAQHARLDADALAELIAAKAAAELADAEAISGTPGAGWRGAPLATLAFVVSGVAPEDRAAAAPLSGEAGEAAAKAAAALGVAPDAFFVLASRPGGGTDVGRRDDRLRLAIEAADPAVLIALDADAATDLAHAYALEPLEPGCSVRVLGRVVGAAGDLAASLTDARAKARVWAAMKAIAAEGGIKGTGRPKGAPRRVEPSSPRA